MTVAGFAVGRASVTPETITETIQEMVEVTREIPVTVAPEEAAEADEGEQPDDSGESDTSDEQIGGDTAAQDEPEAPTPPATETADTDIEVVEDIDFAVFNETWDLIEEEFDGEIPPEDEVLYSAIEGSLETLDDDFTRFIRPEVAERLREDLGGSVEGIGAFVRENEEGLVEIVRPIDGQPADLAGLQSGDIVIAVDGQSVEDESFDAVLLMVRGPEGTDVTLTVVREGEEEPIEFTITRTRFEVPIVESEMVTEDIAYVRLAEFNQNAEERLLEALNELLAQNPQGLILDLRDNPGGLLNQSVAVADVFLPQSVVLYERNRRGLEETFRADDGDAAEEIPMAVLVNAGSASASEIVAGALQDNGRAVVIGETTFGKGSVQQVHRLSDGSELRVTIARWYTPDNQSIDEQGITPDIEVETPDDLGGDDDPQLQRAIEYIQSEE
jgi:carboxyl-terminal processing protease